MDRQTLVAFYFDGRTLLEMSRQFQSPVGTIKRRLHVARRRLAEELAAWPRPEEQGFGDLEFRDFGAEGGMRKGDEFPVPNPEIPKSLPQETIVAGLGDKPATIRGGNKPTQGERQDALRHRDAHLLFLLFLDDDAGGDHHHQAGGVTADAGILEQAVDVGDLVEDQHPVFVAVLAEPLDAAQQHGASVGHADGGRHGDEGERRQLHRRPLRRGGGGSDVVVEEIPSGIRDEAALSGIR